MGNAWDIGEHESSISYATFRTYVMLGPKRTLAQAARMTDLKLSNVSLWSRRNGWVARAKAVEQAIMEAYVQTVTGIVRNSQTIIVEDALSNYNKLQHLLALKIEDLNQKIELNPSSVSADELNKLANIIKSVDDVGRRAAGLPSTVSSDNKKRDEQPAQVARQLGWSNPPPKRDVNETVIEFD